MNMRFLLPTVLSLALILCAVSAYADEKLPDTMDAVATGPRIAISGTLTTSSPIYNRVLTGGPSLVCNANPGLSAVGTAVYYAVHCFVVTDQNPITMILNDAGSSITDTFLTLYCEPFDPLLPRANVIIADDDDGDGFLSAVTLSDNVHLTPGTQYTIVLSTFNNGTIGTYQIDTSTNVMECGPTPAGSATWGHVKSLYR